MKIQAHYRILADLNDIQNAEAVMNWIANATNSRIGAVPSPNHLINQQVAIRNIRFSPKVKLEVLMQLTRTGNLTVVIKLRTLDDVSIVVRVSLTAKSGETLSFQRMMKREIVNQLKRAEPQSAGAYNTSETIEQNSPQLFKAKKLLLNKLKP